MASAMIRARYLMGTVCRIQAEGPDRPFLARSVERAFDRMKAVDRLLSRYRTSSDIGRLNRAGPREAVPVSRDTLYVLTEALRVHRASGGAFDVTAGSGIDGSTDCRTGGSEWIDLDEASGTVRLGRAGLRVDLGAIGKGYAMDEAVKVLRQAGVRRALVDAGGSLYGLDDAGGPGWPVSIEDPRDPRRIYGRYTLLNRAAATSSNAERFAYRSGRRIGHLTDPRTGAPADALAGATVFCASAMRADALSTAAFVLGPEEGPVWLRGQAGAEGVFIRWGDESSRDALPALRHCSGV